MFYVALLIDGKAWQRFDTLHHLHANVRIAFALLMQFLRNRLRERNILCFSFA
jgi:hypothetical protein